MGAIFALLSFFVQNECFFVYSNEGHRAFRKVFHSALATTERFFYLCKDYVQ